MNPASPPSPSQLPNRNEENLAPAEWRITTRREIAEIHGAVQALIQDLRDALKDDDEEI